MGAPVANDNLLRLYRAIREHGPATKAELSELTSLSHPTVLKNLRNLNKRRLLSLGPPTPSGERGGRNAETYIADLDARVALGIDIVAEEFRFALINLGRKTLAKAVFSAPFEFTDAYFTMVAQNVSSFLRNELVAPSRLLGAVVATPGLVDQVHGEVVHGVLMNNLGLSAQSIAVHFSFPVWLMHDSEAGALSVPLSNRGDETVFYLGLSRSVGGALILNGEVFQGPGGFAAEAGHLRLKENGRRCYCGRRGCADPYLNSSVLAKGGSGELPAFFAGVQTDSRARLILETYLRDLSVVIHTARTMFGTPIILGGDVGPLLAPYMGTLCGLVDDLGFKDGDEAADFVRIGYRSTLPVATGAAIHLINYYNRTLSLPPEQRARE